MICHHCNKPISIDRVSFKEECPHCYSYLHCCLNCKLYDPGRPNKCFEPQAERVTDKTGANYCEYFEPTPEVDNSKQKDAKEDAIKKFNDLFKD